jgi:hypothetical protein
MAGKVLISYKEGLNEQDPTGFKEYRVPFDVVSDAVRSAGQYSATPFRDEYRDAAHALQGAELMVLDYDAGLAIAEALTLFNPFIGLIATTRNHQKEKHGITCDRFRVILPTRSPIALGGEDFRSMMKEVINHYNTDQACCNIARMYYGFPDAEVVFLDGCKLFDWEPFFRQAQERERQKQQRQKRFSQHDSAESKTIALDKAIQTFMQNNFTTGARNTTLFRLSRWLQDESVADWAEIVAVQNARSSCPLPEGEVNKILRRAGQRVA